MVTKKISLNLASKPMRNRRLFYFLLCFVGITLVVVSFLAGEIFFTYRTKRSEVTTSIANLEQNMRVAQRKESEFTTKISTEEKNFKGKVDLINGVILRKSFSWMKFLANLENSLPDSSYIVSLAPKLTGESSMEVRFKVVSQNLSDLLKLINNLRGLGFEEVKVESEVKDDRGLMVSEISFRYERTV